MIRFLGIRTFQMVGVPSEEVWSQVHVLIPFTKEEVLKSGGLLLTMRLQGGGDLAGEGNDWIEETGNSFVQSGEKQRVEWISETVDGFKQRFGDKGSVTVAVVQPSTEGKRSVYLHGTGLGMRVRLEREGEQITLWEDLSIGPLSGWLLKGDVLVMGTEKLVEEIWAAIEGGEAEEKGEAAGALISSRGDSFELAGIAAEVTDMEMEEERVEENGSGEVVGIEMGRLGVGRGTTVTEKKETEESQEEVPAAAESAVNKEEAINLQEAETGFVPEAETTEVKGGAEKENKSGWKRFFRPKTGNEAVLPGKGRAKRTKLSLATGGLFVFLLVISVAFNRMDQERKAEDAAYREVSEPLVHQLTEAEGLKDLNPGRARSLVLGVRQTLEGQKDRYDRTRYEGEWNRLIGRTEEAWTGLSGEVETPGEKWLNLEVIKTGSRADDLFVSEDWLGVWDKAAGVMIKVKLGDKAGSITAAGDELKEGVDAADLGGLGVVLTKNGVEKIDLSSGKTETIAEAEGEDWQEWKLVGGYGGNVYTAGAKDIWKIPKTDDGYGRRRRWLEAGVEPDLSRAAAMAINGDIYVALETGEIYKFRLGGREQYSVKNMVGEWGKVAGMAIDESKGLLVWDKGRSRVVNINLETGEYVKQWKWQVLGEADSFAWDEARGRAIIGLGSDLWSFKLD